MLVTTIGYVSGRSLTKDTALEFLAATGVNVGAGLVLRETARAFLKLLPGVGSIASAAVAFAGTMAIGEAAAAYFIDGATPAVVKERMKKARQEAQREGVDDAKD